MLDRVAAAIEVPEPDPDNWMEQAKHVVGSIRAVLVSKPGIAAVAVAQIPIGPQALRVSEGLIAILRAGACRTRWSASPSISCRCTRRRSPLKSWSAKRTARRRRLCRGGRTAGGVFSSLPADRFPNILSLAGPMTADDREERFEFGLDILVGGLAAYGRTGPDPD